MSQPRPPGPYAPPRRDGRQPPRQSPRSRRPYRIVYQDAQIVVVDKDAGILSVPLAGLRSPSVKDLLDRELERRKQTAFTVHRIDRYTSGLIVFATARRARDLLIEQFRAHQPERVYLALVRGVLDDERGTLRHRLQQTGEGFRQRVVREGGTEAVLHFRVRERLPGATLLEVKLETGLKNQIRAQFQAAGFPLVGDGQYAPAEARDPLGRQALHAWRLAFDHPQQRRRVFFEAPLAVDLEHTLDRLRREARGKG